MNTPHPLPRRYVAALVAALCAPAASATSVEPPPLVADGIWLDIPTGTYETNEASRHGLLATNGGQAEGKDVFVLTHGNSASAARVSGPQSEVALIGGGLGTQGDFAHGLYVSGTQGQATTLTHVDIRTEGTGAVGAMFALDGANGRIEGGSIHTFGKVAAGIVAEEGGQFRVEETTVLTEGDNAGGFIARGGSSSLSARGARILTMGKESHGVYTLDTATATLEDVFVGTAGAWANAMDVNAGSGLFTVTRSELHTQGEHAAGIAVADGAPVSVSDTLVETAGAFAPGLDDRGSSVAFGNVNVITHGRQSHGVIAQGGHHPGRLPQVDIRNSRIVTAGGFAYGAFANAGGSVQLRDTSITTTGANAHGLMADGGSIRSTGSTIDVSGDGAYGAIVKNGGSLRLEGGTISSQKGAALGFDDPGLVRIGRGAVISGGNGAFAEVDPTSKQAFTVLLDNHSVALGDIRLSDVAGVRQPDETKLSLSIKNNARWSGASSIVRDLSVESGATWNVTGDSRVGSLRNDHGIVEFAPTTPGAFGTLTITGDYEGNKGLFRMRGRLGDDTSPADLIHVMGNTSGTSLLAVDSLNGAGANTSEGIPLVRVDGRSDGTFQLAGRAVAGAHEYFLHKGSTSQPSDGSWYLRAFVPEPEVEPEVEPEIEPEVEPEVEPETGTDPEEPLDPGVEPAPLLRPEVGTYRANQTAALTMFQGGPGGAEDDERDDARHGVWARFERTHTTFDLRDQITTTTAANELTLGADLLRGSDAVESYVGVMAAAGQSDTRGTSLLTGYSAKGRVRGAAGGIYAGIRTDAGTYLRGWTQYAHFSQRVEGDALQQERYGSGALTASVEAGHRWRTALGKESDAYIEPQAQIVATRLRGGAHTEANGTTIAPAHASGATGRLGTRAAARWQTPNGHVASPYIAASWIRRLGRLDATQMNDEAFIGGVPRNSYALKLGVTFLRRSGWRLWGDVETRFGARNYRRVAGTFGVRKAW